MFALLLDKGLSVKDLVQLSIQLVTIALQLICLGPDMLVDVVKCAHKNQVDLLGDCLRVLLYMLHLRHKLLQLLLDHVLLLSQGDILSGSFGARIGVSVFYSENAPVGRLVLPGSLVLHVARDNAL